MNLFGWVLLLAVAAVAVADGRQAARQRHPAPALGPSFAAVLLGAFAWLTHAEATPAGRFLLLGLLVTVASGPLLGQSRGAGPGRVALAWAVTGAARLLLATAVVALPSGRGPGVAPAPALLVAAALVLGGFVVWRLRGLAGDATSRGAVTAYGALALGVAALASWQERVLAAVGLFGLAAADAGLGWSSLSRRAASGWVAGLTVLLRHVGTALVVVGVVRPDLAG